MLKRIAALTAALAFVLVGQARADVQNVALPFSVTSAVATPWLALSGQSSCSVTYTSVGGGSTATVQGASDGVPTPQTVTGIGTSGVITNPSLNSSFGGPPSPQALTQIRLSFSAVTSGTIAGTLTCTGAAPSTLAATLSGPITVNTPAPCTAGTCAETVTQGPPGAAASPWPVCVVVAGACVDPRVISFVSAQHVIIDSATLPTITITGTVQPGNTQNTTPWLTAGPTARSVITSASATTCTNLSAAAIRVWSISNSGPATVVFPAFYNDAGATCALATSFLGDATTITLGSGQTISWQGGLVLAGLAYKTSGALTAGQNLTISTGPP
jgi:hypothetical protein